LSWRECRASNELNQEFTSLLASKDQLLASKDQKLIKVCQQLLDIQKKIKTVVRIRQPLQHEKEQPKVKIIIDDDKISIDNPKSAGNQENAISAEYDAVVSSNFTQADMINHVDPYVISFVNGKSVAVIANGQSGSGKTYTVIGNEGDDQGILPRVVHQTLDYTNGKDLQVKASLLEINDNKVFDLFEDGKSKTDRVIKKDGISDYFVVQNLIERSITNNDEFANILKSGLKKRTTAATQLNTKSSRSHLIIILKLSGRASSGRRIDSQFYLIDLAGAEDYDENVSNANINPSLTALKTVFTKFINGEHNTYRDNKLTMLLQLPMETCKMMMIVTVSPLASHFKHTKTSLKFAKDVKTKKTPAKKT
jgi:Kinesin motor domain